jgi:hypothetical protein
MLNKPAYEKRMKMGSFEYDFVESDKTLDWRPPVFEEGGNVY